MSNVHWVPNAAASRKAVRQVLLSKQPVIGLGFKVYDVGDQSSVVLVQVGTWDHDVYLFDLRTDPTVMQEGHLYRILQTTDLIKVCHDCRQAARVLKKQSVHLENIFDTQAAYCAMLMKRKLPARQILLHDLYDKFGDPEQDLGPQLELSTATSGFFWSQRPLSSERMNHAAADVQALVPGLYKNISLQLDESTTKEALQLSASYYRGRVRSIVHKVPVSTATPKTSKQRRHTVAMSDEQHLFLDNTVPQAAAVL